MNQLYKHQQNILSKNPRKAMLVWETGTGKTRTACEWANLNKQVPLIVCPKALKTNWQRALKMWNVQNYALYSKEEFSKQWQNIPSYNCVIIDEAHYFSGMKSAMSKNMIKFLKKSKTEFILMLTATPYLSTPMNIYTLGRLLGKEDEYIWSYPYFMHHYFNEINMGGRRVPVIKKDAKEKIVKHIDLISDVVKLADCADAPDSVFDTEYFSLNPDQEKAIKALTDINFITKWTKTHQICGGTLKGDEYNIDQYFSSQKKDRLLELIEQNKKLICVFRYNCEIQALQTEIKNKRVYIINGDVKDKQEVLDKANTDDDCVLLVNAACSEGWEAPTFPLMVFYSLDFSLKNLVQMFGRIQRINALQKCTYLFLVVDDKIDREVYKNVFINKRDFHLEIYDEKMRTS